MPEAAGPPRRVLAAFGLDGAAEPLDGGQGAAFRVGAGVLKPALDPAETEWLGPLLSAPRFSEGRDFRVARPLRSVSGAYVVEGWQASEWVDGVARPQGRWGELLRAGRAFHAALDGARAPSLLSRRTHRWAFADRVAFGEARLDALPDLAPLAASVLPWAGPVSEPPSLVHGDLAGNVLFSPGLPPTIIDVSPYFRPPIFAEAMVVVDAWLWYEPTQTLGALLAHPAALSYLRRALIFRLAALNERARMEPEVLGERRLFERVASWLGA